MAGVEKSQEPIQGQHQPILVVGDAMLDRYWDGSVDRISPEAPVPVLRVTRRYDRAGGAANVALNLAALGAPVTLLALAGQDEAGDALERILREAGVRLERVTHEAYPTIQKIRCVARQHQMLRADFESEPLPGMLDALAGRYAALLGEHRLVVLSDYAKGALAHCEGLIDAARAAGKPLLVDPKGLDWARYAGATLVKPNLKEFQAVAGPWGDDAAFHRQAVALRKRLGWTYLLVTQGEAGMTMFNGRGMVHEPARVREVFDVSGAGDTVLATLAWRMAQGDDAFEAMRWANRAAGIVVGRFGTSTIGRDELFAAMAEAGPAPAPTPLPRRAATAAQREQDASCVS
ncbi:MAG: D-glycero-beta-D-manno-heptose-7-phosphate kinase [Pseudomonadota bacterium]